jgi:hypothetical protein
LKILFKDISGSRLLRSIVRSFAIFADIMRGFDLLFQIKINRTATRYRTVATIMIVLNQNIGFLEAMYEAAATTTASQTAVANTNISRVFVFTASALTHSSGLTVSLAHAFNLPFTTQIKRKNRQWRLSFQGFLPLLQLR